MKLFKVAGIFISLCVANSTYANTLKQVIERTLHSNPDVEVTTRTRLAADHSLRQAQAGYLPSIDVNLGYGWENSDNITTETNNNGSLNLARREASISLKQMLFDGFDTRYTSAQQQARVDASAHRVQESSNIVVLRTIEVFLDVFRRQTLVELAKDNLVVHQKTLEQIQKLFKRGAGRKADVKQAESREALAVANLLQNQGQIRDTEANYQRVTGEMPKDLQEAKHQNAFQAISSDLKAALAQAVQYNPVLKAANSDLDAAQAAYKKARSTLMPKLDVELSASRNNNLDGVEFKNNDVSAILRLNYNLYRGGANQAKRMETAERVNAAKAAVKRAQRIVEEDLRLTWNALQTIRERIAYMEKHVEATQEVVAAYEQQFKLGQRSLLDVLDSKNELYNAKSALVNARYGEVISTYRLLASTGQLLPVLGIEALPEAAVNQHAFSDKD